jgi:hypothetical protein
MKKIILIIAILFSTVCLYSQEWIPPGDDTLWVTTTGGNPIVEGFYDADSVLYMGGGFYHVGNVSMTKVGKWDGQWCALGDGVTSGNNLFTCFQTYKGNLYMGGAFL